MYFYNYSQFDNNNNTRLVDIPKKSSISIRSIGYERTFHMFTESPSYLVNENMTIEIGENEEIFYEDVFVLTVKNNLKENKPMFYFVH